MLNKLTLLMAMAALLAGPVQLSARPCVLINAPSEKACQPACCANKTCCDTSHRNTGATSQPFAKNQSDQQPTATFFAIVKQPLPNSGAETERSGFQTLAAKVPSPRLALLCSFLI